MVSVQQHSELDALASYCTDDLHASPCAVVACAYRGRGGWYVDEGAAGLLAPGLEAANTSTVFDLASLTKPFSALTLARWVERGLLDWHTPLGVPLREAHGTPSATVPLVWLAAHRAGLQPHLPLYEPLEQGIAVDPAKALHSACNSRRPGCESPLSQEDGFPPVYSDLGYLLLGKAMVRASGMPLDTLIAQEVSTPLGLSVGSARQWRHRDPFFDNRVAPTEEIPWRGGLVRGAVHDENAWALAGHNTCAHAGLFGTASDIARLGIAVLEASRGGLPAWLSPSSLEPVLRVRKGGYLRAGFDSKSPVGSSAGPRASLDTFGHLGFTGTSLWIDPAVDVVTVLLTNRVCPTRHNMAIQKARPHIHDDLLGWGMSRRVEASQ